MLVAVLIVALLLDLSRSIRPARQSSSGWASRCGSSREPGLHFKAPFIDSVIHVDKRILDLEDPGAGSDRVRSEAAGGRCLRALQDHDPLRFYQTVGTVEARIRDSPTLLNSALRRVLGENDADTCCARRAVRQLMARVREQLDREAPGFGIEVIDVRIRRADLPEQNSQAVYQRMQTERQREAAEFRAMGSQRAQEIRARADRDVTVLLAEAHARRRAAIRGEGDGERNRIFADAFNQRYGLLRVLPVDAGLRSGDCVATPGCCSSRTRFLPLISSIRAPAAREAPAHLPPWPRRRNDRRLAWSRSR